MNIRTKITVASVMIAVMGVAWTIPSWAHERPRHHVHNYIPDHHRHYYGNYSHYHARQRRSDNDDLAWAVGGFVLGAIIANSQKESHAQINLPPPQRRVQTCYDEVAYDSDDKPYVLRRCVEKVE